MLGQAKTSHTPCQVRALSLPHYYMLILGALNVVYHTVMHLPVILCAPTEAFIAAVYNNIFVFRSL